MRVVACCVWLYLSCFVRCYVWCCHYICVIVCLGLHSSIPIKWGKPSCNHVPFLIRSEPRCVRLMHRKDLRTRKEQKEARSNWIWRGPHLVDTKGSWCEAGAVHLHVSAPNLDPVACEEHHRIKTRALSSLHPHSPYRCVPRTESSHRLSRRGQKVGGRR